MAEQGEVKWQQPDKKVHIVHSVEPHEGYTVKLNENKKWTAIGPKGVIGTDFADRPSAFNAVKLEVYPPAPVASGKEKAAKKEHVMSSGEHEIVGSIIQMIEKNSGNPVPIGNIVNSFTNMGVQLGHMGQANRAGYLAAEGNLCNVTDKGMQAYKEFVVPERKARDTVFGKTPEERAADLLAKHGPIPDWVKEMGPAPTAGEYMQSRLDNAATTLEFAKMNVRLHAYSDVARTGLKNAQERLDMWEKRMAWLKAEGKEDLPATGAEGSHIVPVNAKPKAKKEKAEAEVEGSEPEAIS